MQRRESFATCFLECGSSLHLTRILYHRRNRAKTPEGCHVYSNAVNAVSNRFLVFQPRSFCCLKEPQVLGPMIHWEQRKSGAEKQKERFDGAGSYKHGTPPGFGKGSCTSV